MRAHKNEVENIISQISERVEERMNLLSPLQQVPVRTTSLAQLSDKAVIDAEELRYILDTGDMRSLNRW